MTNDLLQQLRNDVPSSAAAAQRCDELVAKERLWPLLAGFMDAHSSGKMKLDKTTCAVCHGRQFTCMGCH